MAKNNTEKTESPNELAAVEAELAAIEQKRENDRQIRMAAQNHEEGLKAKKAALELQQREDGLRVRVAKIGETITKLAPTDHPLTDEIRTALLDLHKRVALNINHRGPVFALHDHARKLLEGERPEFVEEVLATMPKRPHPASFPHNLTIWMGSILEGVAKEAHAQHAAEVEQHLAGLMQLVAQVTAEPE